MADHMPADPVKHGHSHGDEVIVNEAGIMDIKYEETAVEHSPFSDPSTRSSNPILWFIQWCLSWMIPGMGMFSEAYFIFSIGNIGGLLKSIYPKCWKAPYKTCSRHLINSMTYSQVGGIIAGMILISFVADRIGRKWGSVMTSLLMLVGGILLTASDGDNDYHMFCMYSFSQALFGFGVGGEYPIASTSASERAEANPELINHRGQTVVLTFSMQGVGNFVNVLVLIILLAAFGQTGNKLDKHKADIVWRLSFALGLIPILYMLFFRLFYLKESHVWKAKRELLKKTKNAQRFTLKKMFQFWYHFWHREFGCAFGWFVWDFAFYGNKLFQGTFIGIIEPQSKGNVYKTLQWTLLNSGVALVGYYFAAFTVDYRWMGRRNMQIMGFTWMFVLFIICAGAYNKLTHPGAPIHWFQFMYFLSSFWGQYGPNATTWLLPSESFPTEVRAFGHGFAAGMGKAGALVAGVVFPLVSDQTKFYISAFCGLAGTILTILFIPDLTGLDLRHNDAYWLAICEDKLDQYDSEYRNPKYLSLWERLCGVGRKYNPNNTGKTLTSADTAKSTTFLAKA